jgi:hypothetical protein
MPISESIAYKDVAESYEGFSDPSNVDRVRFHLIGTYRRARKAIA